MPNQLGTGTTILIAFLILIFVLVLQSFFQLKALHHYFPKENREFYRFMITCTLFTVPTGFIVFLYIFISQFLNLN